MTLTRGGPSRSVRFGTLRIEYDDQVLAPRAWTEWQALWAVELAAQLPDGRILELCTGAGQIGLLAAAHLDRGLVAVDLSAAACGFATLNALSAGLAHRVEVRHQPLETACAPGETYPLIIADPPWVPAAETSRFPADPLTAIDGGQDGLDVARACLQVIGDHLAAGGAALLQLGNADQVGRLNDAVPQGLTVTEVRTEAGRGVVALLRGPDSSAHAAND